MSAQTWQETVARITADGSAITNSSTQTSLFGAAGATAASAAKYTFPPNFFFPGRMFKIVAGGRMSSLVTTPGTLTLSALLGSTTIGGSGAMALNAVGKTAVTWLMEWWFTCRAEGSGTLTTFIHIGKFVSEGIGSTSTPAGVANTVMMPATTPAIGTGVDGTVSQALDLQGAFSIANASNTLVLNQFMVEVLN